MVGRGGPVAPVTKVTDKASPAVKHGFVAAAAPAYALAPKVPGLEAGWVTQVEAWIGRRLHFSVTLAQLRRYVTEVRVAGTGPQVSP
jgi:hypothetical protein